MIKFNPENKEDLTVGEILDPIFQATTKQEAQHYKKDYIAFIKAKFDIEGNPSGMSPEEIADSNIGYYSGYGSDAARKKVEILFGSEHPIFGPIK